MEMGLLKNEKILIIGGSGSLGNQLIQTYLGSNEIINYSRDENKHWSMDLKYKSDKLRHIIGDIRDGEKVRQSLVRHKPTIIIIAAALKHIDRCEYEINESLGTNIIGIQNVLNCIEDTLDQLTNLKTVCFISTDKAASPVNIYGMCKSICEGLMVEKSKYISQSMVKFVCVRYGNVLNSRGSIIPILETKCQADDTKELTVTSTNMTRFVMTLEEAVSLIEYAIIFGHTGEIIIPKLRSMRIIDLFELFSEKYNKPIRITGLRSGEKIHESLINETQSLRAHPSDLDPKYYHIIPSYLKKYKSETEIFHYHSGVDTLHKNELKAYLMEKELFHEIQTSSYVPITSRGLQFNNIVPYGYGFKDNFLDPVLAIRAQREILTLPDDAWDRYDNLFEQKYTLRDKNNLPPALETIFSHLNSEPFIKEISNLCGTKLLRDPNKHYWGVHKYDHNDFLKIHVDAGINPQTKLKKHLTLAIYLSYCWKEGYGCDLQIWDGESAAKDDAILHTKHDQITPLFNRAIFFHNSDNSWHGNPVPSQGSPNSKRIFLTVSYLSEEEVLYDNKRTRAFFRPLPSDSEEDKKKQEELSLMRATEDGCKKVYRSKM